MKKLYNKFLIVSTIFLFLGGVYLYFSKGLNRETILPIAMGSSLNSSVDSKTVSDSKKIVEPESKINSDISFLKTIASLRKINIDVTLFTDPKFISLKDNGVKIEKVEAGRINPFAPVQ